MSNTNYPQEKPRVGITLGDINGIGPEVVIKALADNRILSMITPVVYGSSRVLSFYRKLMNLEEFNYSQVKSKGQFFAKAINVVNCWEDAIEINPGQPSKEAGKAALLSLKKVVEEVKEGLIDGFVTGPIDKNTIHGDEFPFRGHTEYLTKEFDATESLMLMVGNDLKVGLVTEHIPVKEISTYITKERVELKIRLLELSLKKDFNISKPKIAVVGSGTGVTEKLFVNCIKLGAAVPNPPIAAIVGAPLLVVLNVMVSPTPAALVGNTQGKVADVA